MREANYTETIEFLSAFFRDTTEAVELRALRNQGGAEKPLFTRDPDEVIAYCQHHDRLGNGVYFGLATRDSLGIGGKREHCRELSCLWAEIDIYKFGMSVEQAVGIILSCPLPPSLIVSSGRGLHVYWLLREPLSVTLAPFGEDVEKARVEAITRDLKRIFAGDPNAIDVTRVLRLPGTHNTREGSLLPCRVLEASWARYELEQVEEFAAECRELIAAAEPTPLAPASGDAYAAYGADIREPFDLSKIERMQFEHPDLSIHLIRVPWVAAMTKRGRPDQEIFDKALAETHRAAGFAGQRWNWEQEEKAIWEEIRTAHRKGYEPKMANEPLPPDGVVELRPGQQERPDDDPLPVTAPSKKPVILVRELAVTADQAEAILVGLGAPFYDRSGSDRLMRPVVQEATASKGRKTKVARLIEVKAAHMADVMSRLIDWRKYDKRSKVWLPCNPPSEVADVLLARAGLWSFPQVLGVITTPTLRPDGSILSQEGYDPTTGLLLLSPPPMPPMPDKVTKDAARVALASLGELLDEFCFDDPASRAVGLSALITPVVRGAMLVAPAHVIRAPQAGSGKTYLVEVTSAISTGRSCQAMAVPKNEEEFEKRIGAVLLSGQAIVSFDNLNGELRGDALAHMVERPLVQIRPLGFSRTIDIESRICVFATGNNITIVGDLVRRSVMASLDANMERPEFKQYGKRPFNMVLADRGRYIAAALNVVRGYQQAGCPGELPELASFGDWSRLVRSALVWLDVEDPVKTIETARDSDPEVTALHDVVAAWAIDGNNSEARTAGNLMGREGMKDALAAVAAGRSGELDAGRLGRWLTAQKNKTVGNWKIVSSGKGGTHGKKWKLMTTADVNKDETLG